MPDQYPEMHPAIQSVASIAIYPGEDELQAQNLEGPAQLRVDN